MANSSAASLDATHGASEPVSKPPLTRALVGALGALLVVELVTRVLDGLAADELMVSVVAVVEREVEAVFSMAQSAKSGQAMMERRIETYGRRDRRSRESCSRHNLGALLSGFR